MKRALRKILPMLARSVDHWRMIKALGVVRKADVYLVISLAAAVVLLEGVGLAMFYPVFRFAEAKGDIAAFTAASGVNAWIAESLAYIGIPLSLLSLCAIAFAFIFLRQVANYFLTVRQELLKLTTGQKLSLKCFSTILYSSGTRIRELKSTEFTTLCDHECQAASSVIRVYMALLTQIMTITIYSSAMVFAQPLASVAAIAVLLALSIPLSLFSEMSRKKSAETLEHRRNVIQAITERFRAWKLIKLANSIPAESTRVDSVVTASIKSQVYLFHIVGLTRLIFGPTVFLFILVVIYYTVEVLKLDISAIALFILIMMRLQPVAQQVNGQFNLMALYDPALRRVHTILRKSTAENETSGTQNFPSVLKHGIDFQGVSFSYPERDTAALKSIDLHIPAGASVAFVGRSGAGKSTLIDLLPRFIEPASGTIKIDGHDLASFSLAELRRSVAYVTQEPFIFGGTVDDNIRYLRSDASAEEVLEAARLAAAADFIDALPQRYETQLGEDGARLSGGQRQRIALARAFLAKPSILILDEPTSALDYETDEAIRQAIKTFVSRNRLTIVTVAHRLSTIRDADIIIVMDAGRVSRIGRPDEILPSLSADDYRSTPALTEQT